MYVNMITVYSMTYYCVCLIYTSLSKFGYIQFAKVFIVCIYIHSVQCVDMDMGIVVKTDSFKRSKFVLQTCLLVNLHLGTLSL